MSRRRGADGFVFPGRPVNRGRAVATPSQLSNCELRLDERECKRLAVVPTSTGFRRPPRRARVEDWNDLARRVGPDGLPGLMGIRCLPFFEVDRRPVWINLFLFRIALPGVVGLAVRRHVGLLPGIVGRRLSWIVFD